MKKIYNIQILLAVLFAIVSTRLAAQTGPFPNADPAVISIVKQGPGDPSPTGSSINATATLKFRVANNAATTAATGKIPAGGLLYTVQFNPYYTYANLVPTAQFAVTFAAAGPPDYVVQLTNTVDINPGDVFDFYINVIGTLATGNPSGEAVTLNVDRTLPIACGNTQTGNDNVFSLFTVTAAGALPVRYIDLTAVMQDQQVNLKWVTKEEVNVKNFELERSTDGRNFSAIAVKQAVGNTSGETIYTYPDNIHLLAAPVIYYRVKVIDVDGQTYYSKIVAVTPAKAGAILVWPSPFTDKVNVRINAEVKGTVLVRLYSATGLVVRQMEAAVSTGTNFLAMDNIGHLPKEVYIIQVMMNNQTIFSGKLVK